MKGAALIAGVAAAALTGAAAAPCAVAADQAAPSATTQADPPPPVANVPGEGGLVPGPTGKLAWTARVVKPTFAKTRPWGANKQALGVRAKWGGGSVQLLVLEAIRIVRDPRVSSNQRLWLRVLLPRRPNGSSGWVPADHVQLAQTRYRVHISTKHRVVQVFRDGKQVRRFRAVVGAPSTPTPHGLFAINEPIRQPNPHGFLGPWALHLTAFSNVLDNYGGGPGRVGIHGRDGASLLDPLGSAASHGCIRIPNSQVRWLARVAPVGTPVRIESGLAGT